MDFVPFLFEEFTVFKDRLIGAANVFFGEAFGCDEAWRLRPQIDFDFSVVFDDVDMSWLMIVGVNDEA